MAALARVSATLFVCQSLPWTRICSWYFGTTGVRVALPTKGWPGAASLVSCGMGGARLGPCTGALIPAPSEPKHGHRRLVRSSLR
jgi:hypothetical protein